MKPLIRLSTKRVTQTLLVVVAALVFVNIFLIYFKVFLGLDFMPGLDSFYELFFINREANIPSYYQALTLLACSGLLTIIAIDERRKAAAYALHWTLMSIIFLGLSIDEATAIHEKAIVPLREAFHTHGLLYFPWVVPAGILVVVFVLFYWGFVLHLPARTRNLFILAGAVYVLGAIGLEMIGAYMNELYGDRSLSYFIASLLEETLEMTGILVFIHALMGYIAANVKDVLIRFGD